MSNSKVCTTNEKIIVPQEANIYEDEIDLEQLKWVVLMVLFNQPGREAAFAWMEDLVFEETTGMLH